MSLSTIRWELVGERLDSVSGVFWQPTRRAARARDVSHRRAAGYGRGARHGRGSDRVGRRRAETVRRVGLHPITRTSRSEEHTSELQSLMRISYAVFCLKK